MTADENGRQLRSQSRRSLRRTPEGTPHSPRSLRPRWTAILSSRTVKNRHHLAYKADGL
jgi:hypothetical protein